MDHSDFKRVIDWYLGALPLQECPASYDHHISGPYLGGNVQRPTVFHTFACLYPDRGSYCAFSVGEDKLRVSAADLRQLISTVEITPGAVQRQRAIADHYVGHETSDEDRWRFAKAAAMFSRLPVGFFSIGNTLADNEQAVYLRVAVAAPLERVIAEFKRATLAV